MNRIEYWEKWHKVVKVFLQECSKLIGCLGVLQMHLALVQLNISKQ